MRRLYVHSDAVAEGKLFCAFISLIVRSYMQNKLQFYIDDNKLTFRKVLLELNKVKRIISAKSLGGSRLLNPATKTLRDVFQLLDVELLFYNLYGTI